MVSPAAKARTPTSAPGNEPDGSLNIVSPRGHAGPRHAPSGFSLLELLVVIAIIALSSALVMLALPDPAHARLEREGARLATLLEAGRAQSRSLGAPVRWVPGPFGPGQPGGDFRFDGLPPELGLPDHWLEADSGQLITVQLPPRQTSLQLGPEPMIAAQRVVLQLQDQRLTLATDGLGPFAVVAE